MPTFEYQITISISLKNSVSEQEYRQLLDSCSDATIFNDWPWLTTAINQLPKNHQFINIIVRDNRKQLVGMIPLRIAAESFHGITAQVARFIQYPLGDSIGILLHPDHKNSWPPLLSYLQKLSGAFWDCLIWDDWTDTQGLLPYSIQWAKSNAVYVYHRAFSRRPPLELKLNRNMREGHPSEKEKLRLLDLRNKLDQLDSTIHHIRPSKHEAMNIVEKIRLAESKYWNSSSWIFSNPETCDFFKLLSNRLAEYGQLDLSFIFIDGELVFYKYGFYFRNTLINYSIGHLPKYARLDLGRILFDDLVSFAQEKGYTAIDDSRDDSETQYFIPETTEKDNYQHQLYFFGNSIKGKYLNLQVAHIKPSIKSLRKKYRKINFSGRIEKEECS